MNAPTPITGYRPLTEQEKALMNKIKAHGNVIGELVAELRALPMCPHIGTSGIPNAEYQIPDNERPMVDYRWVSIGATHLQEGFMALNRAVAKPTTFA